MSRTFLTLLFLSLVLFACTLSGLAPENTPPTLEPKVLTPDLTAIATLQTPASTIAPSPTAISTADAIGTDTGTYPRSCGYQWAQKALPELSASFQGSIQALQPDAQAYAFAFGEDCVYADGSATFIPMETDFNVTLPVGPLSDQETGAWIVQIMQIIQAIPPDQIVGPRPGRVGIIFESNGVRNGVGFSIDQYKALPAGLSSAEIYQALKTQE